MPVSQSAFWPFVSPSVDSGRINDKDMRTRLASLIIVKQESLSNDGFLDDDSNINNNNHSHNDHLLHHHRLHQHHHNEDDFQQFHHNQHNTNTVRLLTIEGGVGFASLCGESVGGGGGGGGSGDRIRTELLDDIDVDSRTELQRLHQALAFGNFGEVNHDSNNNNENEKNHNDSNNNNNNNYTAAVRIKADFNEKDIKCKYLVLL